MKENIKRNILGVLVYFTISFLFGGGFGILALITHEDNDRCHYYNGNWNKGDLTRGCISVCIGHILNILLWQL